MQSGLSDAHGLRGICQQQLGCMDLMQHLHRNLANVNETYRHFMHILHKRARAPLPCPMLQALPCSSAALCKYLPCMIDACCDRLLFVDMRLAWASCRDAHQLMHAA